MRLPYTIRRVGMAPLLLLSLMAQAAVGRAAPQQASAPAHMAGTPAKPSQSNAQPAPLALPDRDFPQAYVDLPFHASVSASGGSGAYSIALYNPLPPGLTFQTGPSTLAIGGIPTSPGNYRFQVVVTDVGGATVSHDYSVNVKPQSQQPGAKDIILTDTEAFTFTDTDNQFFPLKIIDNEGFSFKDSEDEFMPDVIADPEVFRFSDAVVLSLQIGISPSTTPAGQEGVAYSQTFSAVGNDGMATLTPSGTLPTGMSFSSPAAMVTLSGTPTQSGTFPFSLTAKDSVHTTVVTYSLVIDPATPMLSITPSSLSFPSTTVGTSAATQVVTIKNTGTVAVSFTESTTITGSGASSFSRTASTCVNPLAAGASCTNTFAFTPTAAGALAATVTYSDTAAGSPQTVSLSGTGTSGAGLTITPSSLTFPSTAVGTPATAQVVTLKNNTSSSVTFTAATTITGTGASSFSRTASTCANPLAAGASCTNTFTFTPTAAGALSATITFSDSASSTPQTVAVSGTGVAAGTGVTITPTSLTFPSTAVGTSAATQVITLKNSTTSPVTFTAATTITGADASSFSRTASTCVNPLAVGASCTNTFTFKPASAGALTATVTYTDSASSTPQTVALSGTGH